MPEIIDILTPHVIDMPEFTVDISAEDHYVKAGYSEYRESAALYNASGGKMFRNGDNIIILSAGFVLPEQFLSAVPQFEEDLQRTCNQFDITLFVPENPEVILTNTLYYCPELGGTPVITLPLDTYEMAFDIFLSVNKSSVLGQGAIFLNNDFCMSMDASSIFVSMWNVPQGMDGEVFKIVPFIKVKHNQTMYDPVIPE